MKRVPLLRLLPLLLPLSACYVADRLTGPIDVGACPSDEVFFRDMISAPILERDCINCHRPDGFAKDTRFLLVPPEQDPDHLTKNFAAVKSVAENEVDGVPIILLKPTLALSHGGGQRFRMESEELAAFEELIYRFDHPNQCPGEDPIDRCSQPGPQPGPSPLRPLTTTQLENTVRDLFQGRVDPSATRYPKPHIQNGYSTFIGANIVSESGAQDILLSAEAMALQATQDVDGLLDCSAGQTEEACVTAFVDDFGMRAFRRPLRPDERDRLTAIYRIPSFDLTEKVGMIVEAVLQSPQFLYLDETDGETVAEGVVALDDFAVAQRLSYFLWNTMPDDTLFAAAQAGRLSDPGELRAQAERMIADPRAAPVISEFHQEWLQIYELADEAKDPATYPTYSQAMAVSMEEALRRFVEHVVVSENGSLNDLLTSRVAFTDQLVDSVYGTTSGSSGPGDFRPVELPDDQRAGVLTRSAFLTRHAYDAASSPIARGVYVIRNLFCEDLVIPPGLMATRPEEIEGTTPRERLQIHRDQEACAACHDKIDPLGFAFERYDGIGAFRDQYANGRQIDTFGTYDDLVIRFDDALELTDRLVETGRVRDCYATQWFRYAVGRVETDDDCSLEQVQERFSSSGGNVQDLMIGIAESDAFRYRRTEQ